MSVAEPERIRCGACGFDGAPAPEVSARLHEAQGALAQEDARARQLGDLQRRAVALGPRAELLLLGVIALFEGPFLLMIFSSIAQGLAGSGEEAKRQLVGGCSYVPTVLVLTALGFVAFRQLRKMRLALEASCAAVPPGRPGEPARCHVCGGPVAPRGVEAVTRCGYCQADNIVDPRVLDAQAQSRRAEVTSYAGEVTAQARALTTAGKHRAFAWVAAVPLCTCLCGCPNIFLGYQLGLAESPTARCENVLATTPQGRCVGQLRDGVVTVDGAVQPGPHQSISGASGMPRVRQRGTGRTGQVLGGVSRLRECGALARVRWDDGAGTSEVPVAGLCWP